MRKRTPGALIQQPVPVDDAMIGIRKHGEIVAFGFPDLVEHYFGLVVGINADGKYLDLVPVFLIEERFQLTQLRGAVWSPVSSIKDQHDMFFSSVI